MSKDNNAIEDIQEDDKDDVQMNGNSEEESEEEIKKSPVKPSTKKPSVKKISPEKPKSTKKEEV